MSEYLTVKTVYRDEALLRQAIEAVAAQHGIQAELHPAGQEQTLFGYRNVPSGTGQFVVRKAHLYSPGGSMALGDLGWTRQDDGTYRLVMDHLDLELGRDLKRACAFAGDVDVEYQRLAVQHQVQRNPRLRGSRVVANRDARTGAVQIQIQNVRV